MVVGLNRKEQETHQSCDDPSHPQNVEYAELSRTLLMDFMKVMVIVCVTPEDSQCNSANWSDCRGVVAGVLTDRQTDRERESESATDKEKRE
jgi:hypothetical protein